MLWIADPLHPLPLRWRWAVYAFVAVHAARLAIWHGIEYRWGKA